jgi:hypothetical protein
MSSSGGAFEELASPAPVVGPADVERQRSDSPVHVDPPPPSGSVIVEPAEEVEPATVAADPQQRPPPHPPRLSSSQAAVLSVANLRSRSRGLQFSSKAAVIKGGVQKNLLRRLFPVCYDERDFVSYGEVVRYIFVSGNVIFVYVDVDVETSKPLYAILMETLTIEVEDPRRPDSYSYTISPRPNTNQTGEDFTTVLLKDITTHKLMYQITFDTSSDPTVVKRFMDVIVMNSKQYGGRIATSSIVHAEQQQRTKSQSNKTDKGVGGYD